MRSNILFYFSILLSFFASAKDNRLLSGDYSIYSVNTGALIYAEADTEQSYLYGLSAYYVDKYTSSSKDMERAGWIIQETSYGSELYTIRNKFTNLCMSLYDVGYQVVQDNCSNEKFEQLWKIKENTPADNSYSLVSSTSDDVCVYSWPGNSDFFVYTDKCDSYKNLSDWAFVPVIKRGYNNH
ncbi:RICIN domain-containing protein [Aeromonas salmonicida]|uniref:RICIN domain-containing protein n=1 Tax=Aeromonas salmonicida TaxID=645 RepID=UPI003D1DE9BA